MNLLAHSFLSGNDHEISIGNFIGDFVKGKQYQEYPINIQTGILLHRQIDSFTDQHEIVKRSSKRLKNDFGKYAGILVDVFYDYFLAINFEKFSAIPLVDYAQNTYQTFLANEQLLPEKVQKLLPSLIKHDWFVNYGRLEGIKKSLESLDRRTNHTVNFVSGLSILEEQKDGFAEEFLLFFPEIQRFVNDYLKSK